VTLHDARGATLATAVTDGTGQYFFVSADAPNVPANPGPSYGLVPGGVQPNSDYTVTFDASTADTSGIGVPATDLVITVAGRGTPTTGSKPTATGGGLPTVAVHTGGAGANDHTIDAGYQAAKRPAISLVKAVDGDDANAAPGPTVNAGSTVTFTYLVTNSGSVSLDHVAVQDDRLGAITCPKDTLVAGESMTCTATDTAVSGAYVNVGTATGTPTDGSPGVTATDTAHYIGQTAAVLEVTTTVVGTPTTVHRTSPTGVSDLASTSGGGSANLPRTGNDTRGVMLIGLGLIIAGAGLVLTTRRSTAVVR
jgi:LPXTG-motif cell wall-anchored protein